MALDELTFATGGADHGVRLWAVESPTARNFARAVTCRWRSEEHTGAVTALACIGREVVSGSSTGEIFVWNDTTGTPLRRIQNAHEGRSVIGLQFDAVKIVSTGADNSLVVWDSLTGTPLQSFTRPHGDARVAALQFDNTHLMTIGVDRTMRVWTWKGGSVVARGREVVVRAGDTLAAIARAHGVTSRQLLQWNDIPSSALREGLGVLREGMRLVVSERVTGPGELGQHAGRSSRGTAEHRAEAPASAGAGGDPHVTDAAEPAAGTDSEGEEGSECEADEVTERRAALSPVSERVEFVRPRLFAGRRSRNGGGNAARHFSGLITSLKLRPRAEGAGAGGSSAAAVRSSLVARVHGDGGTGSFGYSDA